MKLVDEFKVAEIGIMQRASQPDIMLYDYDSCVQILRERESWSEDEAVDWMELNVVGSWVGVDTPGFVHTIRGSMAVTPVYQ